jgi:hypothetical protein
MDPLGGLVLLANPLDNGASANPTIRGIECVLL